MNSVIDAHHHFWRYNPGEYGWISPAMARLRRDFLPPDLLAEIRSAGVDGVISVQARQSTAETDWLLELAEKNDFIRGIVGWAPLVDPDVEQTLDAWRGRKKLLGLRHVLQDEPDDRFMLRPDFDRGVSLLAGRGLRYDILIYERQLPGAIELVDRHPNQVFILDHIAKPKIKAAEFEPWATAMKSLGERPNVYCKVSGMATEADWQGWSPEQLKRYFDVAMESFGPRRLMFGSDWPVCLVAVEYAAWARLVRQWTAALSQTESHRFWGATAAEAYGLG